MIGRLIRFGLRQGWSRGVLDGNPVWIAVGGFALIGYLAGRVMHRDIEVVFSEKLLPGQSLRITHESVPG